MPSSAVKSDRRRLARGGGRDTRRYRRGLALTGIWLLLSVSLVGAQAMPPEDAIRRMLVSALDNIQRAQCGGQPCAPATPAEKANPPLTIAEARLIISRAALSAVGEHCGLDWRQQNFLPMMAYWRARHKKTERQLALVAILHGIMQGQVQQWFATKPACTERDRRDVAARLPFGP